MKKTAEKIIPLIEEALKFGRFIEYKEGYDFLERLNRPLEMIQRLVTCGQYVQAVRYYELFIAGCYHKADEVDDSADGLGMFLDDLLVGWIKARQKAGLPAQETVDLVIKWIENDDSGFCCGWEEIFAKTVNQAGFLLFKKYYEKRFQDACAEWSSPALSQIKDFPVPVWKAVNFLKRIYVARNDFISYLALCQRFLMTPEDCTAIGTAMKTKGKYKEAMDMVEKGLVLLPQTQESYGSAHALESLRIELLMLTGQKGAAFDIVQGEFEKNPSFFGYQEMMKYVPAGKKKQWHEKAVGLIEQKGRLEDIIRIGEETNQWDRLIPRLSGASDSELESISYSILLPAAKKLEKKHPVISARMYKALAMDILNDGRSKAYGYALNYLKSARDLFIKVGQTEVWDAFVNDIRAKHKRKIGFMGDFEILLKRGELEPVKSFEEMARETWTKQTKGGNCRSKACLDKN